MNSTKLCSRKIGNVVVPTPWPASEGITLFCRNGSSQLMLAAPSRPLPQPLPKVADWAAGTLMVTGASVLNASFTPNVGLIPVGWANFQNSARWKALVTCVVPIEVPPNVWALALTIGEFCVRASALAPGSQLSALVGSQVWPPNFMISGTISACTVVDGLATWIAGFLPTIVYLKVLVPTFTVAVYSCTVVPARADARACAAVMPGWTPTS